jgi:hypothetical protein
MDRKPVSSSSLRSVGYDEAAHVLDLEFHNGRVYRYRSVPAAVHRLLLLAPSLGQFVNQQIKPRFEAELLEEAEA